MKNASNNPELKVIVGSGGISCEGWISTDVDNLNLLVEADWRKLFKPNSIAVVLAEHVWEHLSYNEGCLAVQNCCKYIRPGGCLRIAVPDGFHPDIEYIDYTKPGGTGLGSDDHKVLYTYKSLKGIFQDTGFDVSLLEYFDEYGKFYYSEWDPAQGKVLRSKRFDERNKGGELKYTSIIIDAIKRSDES